MGKIIVKSLAIRNSKKVSYEKGRSKYSFGSFDLNEYYTKDETYNKEEIDEKISGGLDPTLYYTKEETKELFVAIDDELTIQEVDNIWNELY